MNTRALLVANRGEIAVRVLRAAAELGLRSVAVYSEDDARSLHTRMADTAIPLRGAGRRAYLDVEQIVSVARETACDMIHPGYGFLSENAEFARRVAEAGIVFVGPSVATLELCGDKGKTRRLAERCGVPVLPGTSGPTSLAEARDFLASLGPTGAIMIKALAGGGGRGMRAVMAADALDLAYERCRSEAATACGYAEVYVEQLLRHPRHIEVQIIGDGTGAVSQLGERECSLQRRHQKLIEIAPSPSLTPSLRAQLATAALTLASALDYAGLGTIEFLVDTDAGADPAVIAFIEVNPRLQVEHTVSEEVLGLDLVTLQLRLAGGARLAELGLEQSSVPAPRGFALQARVNMERLGADGVLRAAAGALTTFEPPSGPGIRVDTFGYTGYTTTPAFDPLLAKVIAHATSGSLADAAAKCYRALCEFRIEGVPTNIPLLQELLRHPDVLANRVHTHFVEDRSAELVAATPATHRRHFFEPTDATAAPLDPLAVLHHGKTAPTASGVVPQSPVDTAVLEGAVPVRAPLPGTVVGIAVAEGAAVSAGAELVLMEAMKMEHVVAAPMSGIVRRLGVRIGDTLAEDAPLLLLEPSVVEPDHAIGASNADLTRIRPDLTEVMERHALGLDAARAEAVARRRATGQRTARENIDDLCDAGSFIEYGALALAAQRRRRDLDDLVRRTPADGMLCGLGRVNGALFDERRAQCVVVAYDYTVLAGTQGMLNHRKKDRIFTIAREQRLPVVIFTEGGGGRPGDTDYPGVAGLDCLAFRYFGELSGLVPLVGINSGYCFAGNAALLGCCDVVIATANSSIGMGGPAMIEGGGLGVFRPDEVGPMAHQVPNGVVDIAVNDEAEAVAVAKRYLAYFQGPLADWDCADQRLLRVLIPENRLRVYDVRSVLVSLADTDSVLELRRDFGPGMVTALARVEGHPLGVIANNPTHLAGAIDPDGADKAARFMQLCDAHDLPILFLCDTPGIMVGPEVETHAMVRHAARMFVVGASVTVPFFTIVLRKGYGLGAQAMAGGSFHAPIFTVSWPTGEFGGMGLEGAVKLGFRKELAAVEDPGARRQLFEHMVARAYEIGKAVNMASHFEIDDVIDPADSRHWIATALRAAPSPSPRSGKKRPCVDAW